MFRRILKYMGHQFRFRHRKGRGIHSPFLFEFVHDILFNARGFRVPEEILRIHGELRKDRTVIPKERLLTRAGADRDRNQGRRGRGDSRPDFGAGSKADRSVGRTVRSFVRGSSVSFRHGALLYRITRWFEPDMILELGTGLGVSTLYLASGSPGVPLHSFEGHTERAAFAASLACRCGLEQISIHWGEMDEKLEEILPQMPGRFVAFIDANHRYEPTVRYVRMILSGIETEGVIVLDDICWSSEMEKAWKEVIAWPGVRMSLDLFHLGILFLRKDLQKMHLKINF